MFALYIILLANCWLVQSQERYYNLEQAEDHFEQFIAEYNKQYGNKYEKQMRFNIFTENLKDINQKNQEEGDAIYGITQFSDLTEEEFLSQYTGVVGGINTEGCTAEVGDLQGAPDAFDWRSKNVVSRVKDQKTCMSCWAFSCTDAVESAYAIKHNKSQELSKQQLVDCDETSQGCRGTDDIKKPFLYLKEKGAMPEEDYEYENKDNKCRYDAAKVKVKVTDCRSLALNGDEEKLKNLLYKYGPVSIAIDATTLKAYESGIITRCPNFFVNHAVLLVGYGTENDIPYWIIKNSWSEKFGEKGYFRIQRGVNCLAITELDPVQAVVE